MRAARCVLGLMLAAVVAEEVTVGMDDDGAPKMLGGAIGADLGTSPGPPPATSASTLDPPHYLPRPWPFDFTSPAG